MARPTTKSDLLQAAESNYDKLWDFIGSLSEEELDIEFDFSHDLKKKEAHWGRDKNLRDVLIHLYEWHQLLMKWVNSNTHGKSASFLPEPYNWRTYGDMNVELWKKHQDTSLAEAKDLFQKSHNDVLQIIESFSQDELFAQSVFGWTGGSTLGSYCVSVTVSHYDWALKKLKAHRKNLRK